MSYRLWFRLDDVLPLAEHAMACPAHRITGAQARGLAPLAPGLIWTGTSRRDVLVSNGLPGWYSKSGDVHAAEAGTWRHITTDRHGVAGRPDYFQAFLPLRAGQALGPVISMLRGARHTGRHWVTVDIDPADGHLIGPDRVRVVQHRDQLIPPDGGWALAMVTSRAVAGRVYPALVADGYTSDAGYQLPRFDRATVEQMIADLDAVHANPDRSTDPMPGEYPHLRLTGDVLVVFDEHDDGEHVTYRETDRVHPDPEGRYPLGAYTWPWQLAAT
ncbi:hypothetical protein GKC29_25140 [Micromonospora sp. WMMC415]|uniref:hypothetical protein n=1 Tax=Micromonospora sp. WMMC415 TaxID=2675222 RepID=UPI0012B5047C|nr:hypothetical protein [Micromonospora sp. WMMC415]QGN49786.1 hypothetical protein GKC29_25140 [Micromonospora sp. WMMC415]